LAGVLLAAGPFFEMPVKNKIESKSNGYSKNSHSCILFWLNKPQRQEDKELAAQIKIYFPASFYL
jgi:hypothetical protein